MVPLLPMPRSRLIVASKRTSIPEERHKLTWTPSSDISTLSITSSNEENSIGEGHVGRAQDSPSSLCAASDVTSPGLNHHHHHHRHRHESHHEPHLSNLESSFHDGDPRALNKMNRASSARNTSRPKPLEDVFNRSFDPTGAPATFKSLDESAKVRSSSYFRDSIKPTPTLLRRKKVDDFRRSKNQKRVGVPSLRPRGQSVDSVVSSPGCTTDPGLVVNRDSRDIISEALNTPGGNPRGLSLDSETATAVFRGDAATNVASKGLSRHQKQKRQQKYLRPRGTSLDSVLQKPLAQTQVTQVGTQSSVDASLSLDSPEPTMPKHKGPQTGSNQSGRKKNGGRYSPESVLDIDHASESRPETPKRLSNRNIGTSLDTIITPGPSPPPDGVYKAPLKMKAAPNIASTSHFPIIHDDASNKQRSKKIPPKAPRRRTFVSNVPQYQL